MTTERTFPTQAILGRFRLAGDALQGSSETLAARWRGAVASRFPTETAFHGHEGDHTVTRFAEVHYRWNDGSPALFAVGTAAQHVMAHPWPGVDLRIGDHERRVLQVDWTVSALRQSFSPKLIRYEFVSPWLALNQENHKRTIPLGPAARRAELDRILVANLLSMSQGFGWFYESHERVYAAFEWLRDAPCVVKNVALVGFEGTFVTNLELPDNLALGRSVSHGYGWFRRMGA
jgi:hypothetical protein